MRWGIHSNKMCDLKKTFGYVQKNSGAISKTIWEIQHSLAGGPRGVMRENDRGKERSGRGKIGEGRAGEVEAKEKSWEQSTCRKR